MAARIFKWFNGFPKVFYQVIRSGALVFVPNFQLQIDFSLKPKEHIERNVIRLTLAT